MITVVETCTPEEIEMREAFFDWQHRGFKSAWASLVSVMHAKYGWQPITAENLPKVGDEVYSMPQPGCFYPDEPGMVFNPLRVDDLRTFKGWTCAPRLFTHFRPLNPPKPDEKPAL